MIGKMFRTTLALVTLLSAGLLAGCGTATTEPGGGSKAQATTGISESGYPAGQPTNAGSPALGSSTESKYSRDQQAADEPAHN